jgi:Ca2+-binding RTX toxin-like protein/subtilisin-like proprotein convertase family protein
VIFKGQASTNWSVFGLGSAPLFGTDGFVVSWLNIMSADGVLGDAMGFRSMSGIGGWGLSGWPGRFESEHIAYSNAAGFDFIETNFAPLDDTPVNQIDNSRPRDAAETGDDVPGSSEVNSSQTGGQNFSPESVARNNDTHFDDNFAVNSATFVDLTVKNIDGDNASAPVLALAYTPSDPLFSDQWHLNDPNSFKGNIDINVTKVWDDYTGEGVRVGVVDDGVQYDHTDLATNYDPTGQYDYGGNDVDPYPTFYNAHGTAVAGLIAADDNGVGVVGVAYDATVTAVRIFGGSVSESEFADVFYRQGALDVTNNSWGYGGYFYDNLDGPQFDAVGAAIENAVASGREGLGTVLLWAAGNSRLEGQDVNYHGFQNARESIAVAATDDSGKISYYSTPGAPILVSAPSNGGVSGIVTTDLTGNDGYSAGDYTYSFGGTSAATPITAGVVALMLEANPDLGYRDVQEILAYSAKQIDPTDSSWAYNGADNWNGGGLHTSHDFGFGLVDAYAAVRLAESWTIQSTRANEASIRVGNSFDQSILDNAAITSAVHVDTGLDIDHVEVELVLGHTFIGDLTVILTSPDGTDSVLVNRPGKTNPLSFGSAQDNIVFTLSSTNHWGETGAGDWTLEVADSATGDTGVLYDWTLGLYGDAPNPDDFYIFTDEFDDYHTDSVRTTLSDSSGMDTINVSAMTQSSRIDLAMLTASEIGWTNFAIAEGTVIENVIGGDGGDRFTGNDVDNHLIGGRGGDMLAGGGGADFLDGGLGDDNLYGNAGIDKLAGGAGDDWLDGGDGADTLDGGVGDDWLDGDDGDDALYAGGGNDKLRGGAGADTLSGGAGHDIFKYGAGDGFDRIEDFAPGGGDLLDLTNQSAITSFDLLLAAAVDDGANTIITIDVGDQVTLAGVQKADLTADDFVIPALDDGFNADSGEGSDLVVGAGVSGSVGFEPTPPPEVTALLESNAVAATPHADDEYFTGTAGDDTVDGGSGSDWLAGGAGNDTAVFGAGWGLDIVDLSGNATGQADSAVFTTSFFQNLYSYRTGEHFATLDLSSSDAVLMMDYDPSTSTTLGSVTMQVKNGGTFIGTPTSDLNGDGIPDFQQFAQPLFGTPSGDTLTSTTNTGFVWGGLGDDTLTGSVFGADILFGGGGDDTLNAGTHDEDAGNILVGGSGNDRYHIGFGEVVSIYDNAASTADTIQIDGLSLASGTSFAFTVDNRHLGVADVNSGTYAFFWDWQTPNGKIESVFLPTDGVTYTHAEVTSLLPSSPIFTGNFTWAELGLPASEVDELLSSLVTLSGDDEGPTFNAPIGGTNANETLYGFSDDNIIIGDGGNDTLIGRGGDDIYVLRPGDGTDTIDNVSGAAAGEVNVLRFAPTISALDVHLRSFGIGTDSALYLGYGGSDEVRLFGWYGANASLAQNVIVETAGHGAMALLSGSVGTDSGDFLIGGFLERTIDGGGGDDFLFHEDDLPSTPTIMIGGDGNDVVRGGTTQDGGLGDDTLIGNVGFETLLGGAGDDVLFGNNGRDVLDGGLGNDTLDGGHDVDTLDGGDGNDQLYGDAGNDLLFGGSDDDVIHGGDGNDELFGGIWFYGDQSLGDDTLFGDGGDDRLVGAGGNDVLSGGAGNDRLDGGDGTDRLSGDGGNDRLFGNSGNDHLIGGDNADTLNGGAGVDRLDGDGGNDVLFGGPGDDFQLIGGSDDDVIHGGDGNDELFGGIWNYGDQSLGDDTLFGDGGDDRLVGAGGNDVLSGGAGNDRLDGGDGDDRLISGDGADVLDGGAGDDVFVAVNAGFGSIDGGGGTDVLEFTGSNQSFNLTALSENQLNGLERIDFGGSGDNTLILDQSTVFSAAGASNNLTGTPESLLIDGDAGDVVNTGAGWIDTGSVTIGGNGYSVYESDENGSQLFVNENVNVTG